jgi:hypothetical protein
MEKPQAIQKVKLLLKLARSAPEHEAANATSKADDLISRFGLDPKEYDIAEEKPLYTDDALLYAVPVVVEWMRILALTVGNKYDCFVIQEENVASTGERVYKYFVYGHENDVPMTKELFKFVSSQIEGLIALHCVGKSELYTSSFGEGAVNGIRINIEFESFNLPGMVKAPEKPMPVSSVAIAKIDPEKKEAPLKEKVEVNNPEKDIDIIGYFTGESYGRGIHINGAPNDKELPISIPKILGSVDYYSLFDDDE